MRQYGQVTHHSYTLSHLHRAIVCLLGGGLTAILLTARVAPAQVIGCCQLRGHCIQASTSRCRILRGTFSADQVCDRFADTQCVSAVRSPTLTPTHTLTAKPQAATSTPTLTFTPRPRPSNTPTSTWTYTSTATSTLTPTQTNTPTQTATPFGTPCTGKRVLDVISGTSTLISLSVTHCQPPPPPVACFNGVSPPSVTTPPLTITITDASGPLGGSLSFYSLRHVGDPCPNGNDEYQLASGFPRVNWLRLIFGANATYMGMRLSLPLTRPPVPPVVLAIGDKSGAVAWHAIMDRCTRKSGGQLHCESP